jgi:hypothetical protein
VLPLAQAQVLQEPLLLVPLQLQVPQVPQEQEQEQVRVRVRVRVELVDWLAHKQPQAATCQALAPSAQPKLFFEASKSIPFC